MNVDNIKRKTEELKQKLTIVQTEKDTLNMEIHNFKEKQLQDDKVQKPFDWQ